MPATTSRVAARRRLAWLRRSAAAGTLTLAMLHSAPEARAQTPVAVGPEFRINTTTLDIQLNPSVAMDADGDFVVSWESRGLQDGDGFGVFAQRYAADGTPQGGEFQVNTYTTDDQRYPAVGMDADGDFVVAWQSRGQDDPNDLNDFGVYAQRFGADGTPQGSEFQVNTYTTGRQLLPSIGMDADGDFLIVWNNLGGTVQGLILGQRYDADGTPLEGELRVNDTTRFSGGDAAIGMNDDGDFVIAWSSGSFFGGPDGDRVGVFAQRYASDGTLQGERFQVNTYTTNDQGASAVGMDADGNFVIAWTSSAPSGGGIGQDGSGHGVFAQRYAADGTPQGSEFQVNTYTTAIQSNPTIGVEDDGDFVIAWESGLLGTQDGFGSGVYAQRYGTDGTPEGSEFQVNTYTSGNQQRPAIGMDAEGDFVAVWESEGQDSSGYGAGIFAQRFAASPVANEDDAPLPTALALDAVFPNPVRDAATLRYALPTPAAVRLTVTDVLGRTVLRRAEGVQPAGEHEAQLVLDDLPSGIYVVRLEADGTTATQRMTVVR